MEVTSLSGMNLKQKTKTPVKNTKTKKESSAYARKNHTPKQTEFRYNYYVGNGIEEG